MTALANLLRQVLYAINGIPRPTGWGILSFQRKGEVSRTGLTHQALPALVAVVRRNIPTMAVVVFNIFK
jgi:hypothetical protein